jgi:hypothetical protein
MDEHIPVKTSVKRRRYPKAFKARSDVFYYIEIFYNRKRKHGSNHLLSPVEFVNRYQQRLESVYRFGGDSFCSAMIIRFSYIDSPLVAAIYPSRI